MIPIQLDKHMYEVGHHFIMNQNESLHKIYLKMDLRPNVRVRIVRLWEENIQVNLCDLGLVN